MKIRVLSSDDVRQALPMKAAIEECKRAYSRLSSGNVEMPLRSRVHVLEQDGLLLTMPAALLEDGEMAVKLVTVFGKNPTRKCLGGGMKDEHPLQRDNASQLQD